MPPRPAVPRGLQRRCTCPEAAGTTRGREKWATGLCRRTQVGLLGVSWHPTWASAAIGTFPLAAVQTKTVPYRAPTVSRAPSSCLAGFSLGNGWDIRAVLFPGAAAPLRFAQPGCRAAAGLDGLDRWSMGCFGRLATSPGVFSSNGGYPPKGNAASAAPAGCGLLPGRRGGTRGRDLGSCGSTCPPTALWDAQGG